MILFIDTTEHELLRFALVGESRADAKAAIARKNFKIRSDESHTTAAKLDSFLRSRKEFKKDRFAAISKIFVVSGPGSFVGIRTGLALALAIGFAQGIPLFALKGADVPKNLRDLSKAKKRKVSPGFEADYGAPPQITMPKNALKKAKK